MMNVFALQHKLISAHLFAMSVCLASAVNHRLLHGLQELH